MTFFEKELTKMFGENEYLSDIRCTGNALIGRLTENTIAKITFAANGTHGNYESALIKVINPKIGEVDRHNINFNDVFGHPPREKIYIWDGEDGTIFWCNFKPAKSHYDTINRAAEKYLEMFSEPIQDMQMRM